MKKITNNPSMDEIFKVIYEVNLLKNNKNEASSSVTRCILELEEKLSWMKKEVLRGGDYATQYLLGIVAMCLECIRDNGLIEDDKELEDGDFVIVNKGEHKGKIGKVITERAGLSGVGGFGTWLDVDFNDGGIKTLAKDYLDIIANAE